jgi:uncharacterized membrane protein
MLNPAKKITLVATIIFLCTLFVFNTSYAKETIQTIDNQSLDSASIDAREMVESVTFEQELFRAKVLTIIEEETERFDADGNLQMQYQYINVTALDGQFQDLEIEMYNQNLRVSNPLELVEEGDTVVVYWSNVDNPPFTVEGTYKLNKILVLLVVFLLCVLAITRLKGLRAIISLILTFSILLYFIAPQIAAGTNVLVVSVLGSIVILAISIFIGHGIKPSSIIAFISSSATLFIAVLFSYIAVHYPNLQGYGNEDAFWLYQGSLGDINIQGLLLAGIIISIIGILDDVTIIQASLIEELHSLNPALKFKELFRKGFRIGKDHIISMVNTLIIIYAGVALPIIVYIGHNNQWEIPAWARLNQQALVEEMARALAGSTALLFAVPITTAIAAYAFSKRTKNKITTDKPIESNT